MLKIGQERRNPGEVPHSHKPWAGHKFACCVAQAVKRWGGRKRKQGLLKTSEVEQMNQIELCATQPHWGQGPCQGSGRYCSVLCVANLPHQTWTFYLLYGTFTHHSFSHGFLPHAFLCHYYMQSHFLKNNFLKN